MHYPSIRIEGNILSADLIDLIENGNKHSQDAKDFGFDVKTQVKDEIADAWANARAYWTIYQNKLAKLDESASAVSETRNLWIIPLLGMLGYSVEKSEAESIDGKSYAISHRDSHRDKLPIHVTGWREQMDKRRIGQSRLSPHATLQEYLNMTEHLYGLVSNGKQLRLLRDSTRLIKLTYLEFDLERMFEEELFADFAILFRLVHASRLPSSQSTTAESIIERYHQDALESGSRIRDGLRDAVEDAMSNIANGLLKNEANFELRQKVENGEVTAQELHHALLRLIYRLLFLMVIEERNLIHTDKVPLDKRNVYFDHYSIARLRRMADKLHLCDPRKTDLWHGLSRTLSLFEESGKGRPLGIEPLGSELFRTEGINILLENALDNGTLLKAILRLSVFSDNQSKQTRRVNYGALDVEELGSIYESLLELQPVFTSNSFSYYKLAGSERKTTGSYYTPAPLVQELIKSALVPVLEKKIKEAETPEAKEKALLSTRVCDPACGSGAFLIAAAHHLCFRLAKIRRGEDAHAPEVQRHAMRDVVAHCLFGVDINPLSVELCKVSLWLLAVEPGKPLSFLSHHIRCGNSLLGTNPALIAEGIPQAAYKPLTGDSAESVKWMKDLNKEALKGQTDLFSQAAPLQQLGNIPNVASQLETDNDDTIEARSLKEETYRQLVESSGYENSRLLADTWCAAFVWSKDKSPNEYGHEADGTELTTEHLRKMEKNPDSVSHHLKEQVKKIATNYRFFHWHLEFPAVFRLPGQGEKPDFPESGLSGGFDVMLGNPPWEHVELKEKEFFATRDTKIANAKTGAARKKLIAQLENSNPSLFEAFCTTKRLHEGMAHMGKSSGNYPFCGRGRINFYAIFAELFRTKLKPSGRMGGVFPSGIASDDTTKLYFQDLVEKKSLVSLFDFENKNKIFQGVHSEQRFCLLTAGSPSKPTAKQADLAFFCLDPQELQHPEKRFSLAPEDISLLNPNTRTCPIFRTVKDAELTKAIYRRVPVLINENEEEGNPWGISFKQGLFNMTSDSHLFHTSEELETKGYELHGNTFKAQGKEDFVPLYEGKLFDQYNSRFSSFYKVDEEEKRKGNAVIINQELLGDPHTTSIPRYWVSSTEIPADTPISNLMFRLITNPNNERTSIAAVISSQAAGHSTGVINLVHPINSHYLNSILNSTVFDWLTRLKVSSRNLSFFVVKQLASVLPHQIAHIKKELFVSNIELTYTANDLSSFAQECGYDGPPFRWDANRRFLVRCELDALFFHLYLPCDAQGNWKPARIEDAAVRDETEEELATLKSHFPTPRHAVEYIMETFPLVKNKDIASTEVKDAADKVITEGTYITKTRILELYDAMLEARQQGKEWQSPLSPPPGPPTDAEGNFIPFEKWKNNIPSHIHSASKQSNQVTTEEPHWLDRPFALVSENRESIDSSIYKAAIWPELICQYRGKLPFETFRKAYWLLTKPSEFKNEGRKHCSTIPDEWWQSRTDQLEVDYFFLMLKGSVKSRKIEFRNENETLYILWNEPNQEDCHFPHVIDDARIALLSADLWQDDVTAEETQKIETLLKELQPA